MYSYTDHTFATCDLYTPISRYDAGADIAVSKTGCRWLHGAPPLVSHSAA